MLGRSDGWARTCTYGAAHYGKSLFWYGGEVLFAFFLTEVAGLDPADMAFVLATGLLISGAFDLQVGRMMSRGPAGMRRAARLQAAGALLSGATLVAFFATPLLPEPLRMGWALVAGVIFRFAFSIYDVPQGTLMSAATVGDQARSRVAVTRIFGTGLATLTTAAVVGPLIAAQREGGGGSLLMTLAAAASLIAGATALALWRLLSSVDAPADTAPAPEAPQMAPTLIRLWPLFAMMVVMMLGPPLFQKLEPYFATRSFPSAAMGGAVIVAAALGICSGQPLWLRVSSGKSRLSLFIVGAALQALGALLVLTASLDNPPAFLLGAWLFGLGNGGLGMAQWASFSDAAARAPPHLQGLAFAAFAATGKVTLAFGVLVIAIAISAGREDPERLRWAMTLGPMAASLGMLLLARRAIAAAR